MRMHSAMNKGGTALMTPFAGIFGEGRFYAQARAKENAVRGCPGRTASRGEERSPAGLHRPGQRKMP